MEEQTATTPKLIDFSHYFHSILETVMHNRLFYERNYICNFIGGIHLDMTEQIIQHVKLTLLRDSDTTSNISARAEWYPARSDMI